MSAPSEVISVIRHEVRPGSEERYEGWIGKIVPVAKRFPGHAGVTVVRPPASSRTYTVVVRFDEIEHLQAWLGSDTRTQLLEEIEPHLSRADLPEIQTGLEFWVTTPEVVQRAASPFKQFLLVLSVIYPLTLVVPMSLQPLLTATPGFGAPYARTLVSTIVIVALMTYIIMPRYTRLVTDWLYRETPQCRNSSSGRC
jgi:antibiotic biosynthesis monooxygenase (ABM) superfamily enzyme